MPQPMPTNAHFEHVCVHGKATPPHFVQPLLQLFRALIVGVLNYCMDQQSLKLAEGNKWACFAASHRSFSMRVVCCQFGIIQLLWALQGVRPICA